MRALLQRVREGSVGVDGGVVGEIGRGFVVFLGVGPRDDEAAARQLADRVAGLRVFADDAGRMNRSLVDVGGEALVVSQFTLFADCRKGRRPSFVDAAPPERAEPLCDTFVEALRELGVRCATGRFGASMEVALVNDGPVTILLDTDELRRPRKASVPSRKSVA